VEVRAGEGRAGEGRVAEVSLPRLVAPADLLRVLRRLASRRLLAWIALYGRHRSQHRRAAPTLSSGVRIDAHEQAPRRSMRASWRALPAAIAAGADRAADGGGGR